MGHPQLSGACSLRGRTERSLVKCSDQCAAREKREPRRGGLDRFLERVVANRLQFQSWGDGESSPPILCKGFP